VKRWAEIAWHHRDVTIPPGRLPVDFVVSGVPASSQGANRARKAAWTRAVRTAAENAWKAPPLDTKVRVIIRHYGRGGRVPDVDNMAKPILDAITGTVWVDDRQVESCDTGRADLDGAYRVSGISMVLAKGFFQDEPFTYVKILELTDQELLP
jgi:Holliday junction resolvase RusA-like endonuclease